MAVIGSVDILNSRIAAGWAWNAEQPDTKVTIEVLYKGKLLTRVIADSFREDLRVAKIGDGRCSFSISTPHFIPTCELRNITLRCAESGTFLPFPAAADLPNGQPDLWIDKEDLDKQIQHKLAVGALTEDVAATLRDFARDGYVILSKAVPDELIEALNADIDRVWSNPPAGMMIDTLDSTETKMDRMPVSAAYRDKCTKLLELHAYCHSARAAIMTPKVMTVLGAVFEAKPKAFQTLTFWNGSRQPIHKDSAYVRIDTNPSRLVATWLALEDLSVGSGELEYYVGSHKGPEFLFSGLTRWINDDPDEHKRFLKILHDDASRLNQPKQSFLAKRGDVLIWHADLAHGGSTIRDPSRSRRSLVTHFTSALDEPYYRRYSQFPMLETDSCVFVSEQREMSSL